MINTDPECKDELVKADGAAVVLVETCEQIIELNFRHVHSVVADTILQFLVVQHSTPIVIIDSKRSIMIITTTTRRSQAVARIADHTAFSALARPHSRLPIAISDCCWLNSIASCFRDIQYVSILAIGVITLTFQGHVTPSIT